MYEIKIKDKKFKLKLTLEGWKKLKVENDLTPANVEMKMLEDTASVLSALVYYAIDMNERNSVDIDELDASLDFRISEIIGEVIASSLPDSVKEKAKGSNSEKK